MEGWELAILNPTVDSLSWANTRIIMEELNGDVLNDAFFNRNQMLMEKYNFVLKVDEINHYQIPTILQTNVLAGDDAYQILHCSGMGRRGLDAFKNFRYG